MKSLWMRSPLIVLILCLAACAGTQRQEREFAAIKVQMEQGHTEEGLAQLKGLIANSPENREYRAYYMRQRDLLVQRLIGRAEIEVAAGRHDGAEALLRQALSQDPDNARVRSGIEAVAADRRHRAVLAEAEKLVADGNLDAARDRLRAVLLENPNHADARQAARRLEETVASRRGSATPILKLAMKKPVTLELREAPLKSAFDVISRTAGINFVFDRDMRPDMKATILVRNTPVEEAVRMLLVANQLASKPLNENTLLVFPNSAAKLRDYQDLTVRNFYLANVDAKNAMALVKTVVKTRDLYVDERLNLLVMRDTPEAIRLAEKLVAAQDLAEPEVMLEVEVLEVSHTRLQELGIGYPNQVAFSVGGAAGAGRATLQELRNFNSSMVQMSITDPALVFNLKQQDGDTNILANPRIRVRNRDKAHIHIGDKLPVITTTSTANVGISESVSYLDVGLKLDVEPVVRLHDEVFMKVGLEVSNITQQIKSTAGSLTYQVGSRTAATSLQLKNGETQVLAGLVQDEDRASAAKVPGLANLPILGRLFSSDHNERNKTEIVLLITPYIMRNIGQLDASLLEYSSGTEAAAGAGGPASQSADAAAATAATPAVPSPAVPAATPAPEAPSGQPK